MLGRIILPRFGGKKVNAVQSRDIQALHVVMQDTPYQANRVLALLSKMFSLATNWIAYNRWAEAHNHPIEFYVPSGSADCCVARNDGYRSHRWATTDA